jgi:hypothetical protein
MILSQIDDLQEVLKLTADEDERMDWWSQYNAIKYQIQDDKSSSQYERDTVDRIGKNLTEFIVAIRDKLPSPNKSAAVISLGALRDSIAARTVGVDGYKLK